MDFVFGTVAASRGEWGAAQAALGQVELAATGAADTTWAEMLARILKSAICRARADPAGVIAARRPLATDTRIVVSQMAMIAWWPILIEGLIEAGETGDVTAELDRLARHVDDTGMAIGGQLAGLRARLAAAKGDPDDAARLFDIALRTIRPDDGVIDRGLLRHQYICASKRDMPAATVATRSTICGRRMSCSVVSAPSRIGKPSPMTLLRVESGRPQSNHRWT